MPESVGRKHKVPDGKRQQVDEHPTDVDKLSRGNDDQGTGKTQDEGQQNERKDGLDGSRNDGDNDEVDCERDGGGQDQGTDEFHSNDELHGEAERTTEVSDKDEFEQVVNGRVDPSSTLREEDSEGVGYNSLADSLRTKDHLSLGEGLEHQGGEVTIFSEQEQVLLVQGVDNVLGVVLANVGVCQDRNPVTGLSLGRLDTVDTETSGKTSHTSEHRLESLGQVVGNVVLEDCQ